MIPEKLSAEEKQKLESLFAKSSKNTLQHDIDYIARLKPTHFDKLCESSRPRERELGECARLMQQFVSDFKAGRHTAPPQTLHAFTTVLLYLINPFDLIADKDPIRGYCDDIYILQLGLAESGDVLRDYATAQGKELHLPNCR